MTILLRYLYSEISHNSAELQLATEILNLEETLHCFWWNEKGQNCGNPGLEIFRISPQALLPEVESLVVPYSVWYSSQPACLIFCYILQVA